MKTNTKMAKVSKTVQGALDFARALGETQFSGEKTRKEVLAYAKARSCYRRGFREDVWFKALWKARGISLILHRKNTTRGGRAVQLYFCSNLDECVGVPSEGTEEEEDEEEEEEEEGLPDIVPGKEPKCRDVDLLKEWVQA